MGLGWLVNCIPSFHFNARKPFPLSTNLTTSIFRMFHYSVKGFKKIKRELCKSCKRFVKRYKLRLCPITLCCLITWKIIRIQLLRLWILGSFCSQMAKSPEARTTSSSFRTSKKVAGKRNSILTKETRSIAVHPRWISSQNFKRNNHVKWALLLCTC